MQRLRRTEVRQVRSGARDKVRKAVIAAADTVGHLHAGVEVLDVAQIKVKRMCAAGRARPARPAAYSAKVWVGDRHRELKRGSAGFTKGLEEIAEPVVGSRWLEAREHRQATADIGLGCME